MKRITWLLVVALTGCSSTKLATPTASPAEKKTPEAAASPSVGKPISPANAAPAALTCKAGKDIRVLEKSEKNAGCELKYTKFGETNVVASSAAGGSHCDKIRDQIRSNLEKSGYKCE